MEAYDGAVILATNFKRNIDDAFIRRLDFVVDFPFPEAEDRERIWALLLPAEAPVADDVDLDFLARSSSCPAARSATARSPPPSWPPTRAPTIEMRHLVRAVAQEYASRAG